MCYNLWWLMVAMVVHQQAMAIQQRVDMNQEYYQHLIDHHTYPNYLLEMEAIRHMLDQFHRLPLPDKHLHLAYLQSRPEFTHLSRYFQFSGLLQAQSLQDTIQLLLHLQHQHHLDHHTVIFTPPDIHPKAIIPPQLAQVLTHIEHKYDLKTLVEQELEQEIFNKDNVHAHFEQLRGGKGPSREGEGYYPSGSKKINGIEQEDRVAFMEAFHQYLVGVANGTDWTAGPDKMHKAHQKARAQAHKTQQQQQAHLVQDILSHHTTLDLPKNNMTQVMDIGRQVVDIAMAQNHSYSHLHQFRMHHDKVILTNQSLGSSYFQVDQRFGFYDGLEEEELSQEQERETQSKKQLNQLHNQQEQAARRDRLRMDTHDIDHNLQTLKITEHSLDEQDMQQTQPTHYSFKEQDDHLPDTDDELDSLLEEYKQKVEQDQAIGQQQKQNKKDKLQQIRDCKLKKKQKIEAKKIAALEKMSLPEIPPDIISPLIVLPIEIPMVFIKAIVLLVLMIIGQIIHICLPAGPLTMPSCPEAAPSLVNIYQLFQFAEKNKLIDKQLQGYQPFYLKIKHRLYKFGLSRFLVSRQSQVEYMVCGQAAFTNICSQVWAGCDLLAFLFTNPPILTLPPTVSLPPLAWNNIIPGDMPFCFMQCIVSLVACLGVQWVDLNICSGLFNLDNLIRMMMAPNLLLFAVFSFVPGFCAHFPFAINMWKLYPIRLDQRQQRKEARQPEGQADCANETDIITESPSPSPSPYQAEFAVDHPAQFPYEVVDKEKEYSYKNWEFDQRPYHWDNIGFRQNVEKKKDEDKASLEDKASQMYQRSTGTQDKEQFIREKAKKMERAYQRQEREGKPSREDASEEVGREEW